MMRARDDVGEMEMSDRGRLQTVLVVALAVSLGWLGLASGVVSAVDVEALKTAATQDRSVSAAYQLWKHYFTQGQQAEAGTWWQKAKSNATELMSEATTEAEKAEPEVALIRARLGRGATILGMDKTPEEKVAILTSMSQAEPTDAWVLRDLALAKAAANRPAAEIEAAWGAAMSVIDSALEAAQTDAGRTLIRDNRVATHVKRLRTLEGRDDYATAAKPLVDQMAGVVEGTSQHAGAVFARELSVRYTSLKDWAKAVEWAKETVQRHLAMYPNDRGCVADMSVGWVLAYYAGACEKDQSLAAGLKAYADWAASWAETHSSLDTRSTREALFRAYDAAGEYGKGDEWHLKFLSQAFAGMAELSSEKARADRWSWIEGRSSRRLFRQRLLVKKDSSQAARLVAHGDALKALLVAPNDRIGLINAVVKLYDDAGAEAKGSALFAAMVSQKKAQAASDPRIARALATVLAERAELLRYRRATEERVALLNDLDALLKSCAEARVKAVEMWTQQYYLCDRAKMDEWYGLVHQWDTQAYAAETDPTRRAALYADLKEHMLMRLTQLRSLRDHSAAEAQLTDLRKELQPGVVPADLLLLQRAHWVLGGRVAWSSAHAAAARTEIETFEQQLAAAATGNPEKARALVEDYYWPRAELEGQRQPPLGGMDSLRKALPVCPDDAMRLRTYKLMAIAYVSAERFDEAGQILQSVAGQFTEDPLKQQMTDLVAWVGTQKQAAQARVADRRVRIQIQVLEQKIKLLTIDLTQAQEKSDAPRVAGLERTIAVLQAELDEMLKAQS